MEAVSDLLIGLLRSCWKFDIRAFHNAFTVDTFFFVLYFKEIKYTQSYSVTYHIMRDLKCLLFIKRGCFK
jgi:hypothetical protein